MTLAIVSCVFNDWDSAKQLVELIEIELRRAGLTANMVFVDDGSTDPVPHDLKPAGLSALESIDVLQLRGNVGHQRAIAIGLSFLYENRPCDAVVVMDADGEDKPSDIVRLVQALRDSNEHIIFAKRSKRSEGLFFTLFYHLYRWVFFGLTGKTINFGNFSIIPFSALHRIVIDTNLWNHYAAAVASSRLLFKTITSKRGKRLCGKSKLNFTSLVIHGLSAMSCYNEIIATRLLFITCVAIVSLLACIVAVVVIRLCTDLYMAGWATYTIGILTIISLQVLLLSLTFLFTLLGNRKNQPFIPLRDYKNYIV